jgi:hypothetical protein
MISPPLFAVLGDTIFGEKGTDAIIPRIPRQKDSVR